MIETAPGEEAQVDYGDGPMVRDPQSGKYRRARLPQKIVLIGGRQLAALMIDHNVGVSLKSRVSLKRLNEDYFEAL